MIKISRKDTIFVILDKRNRPISGRLEDIKRLPVFTSAKIAKAFIKDTNIKQSTVIKTNWKSVITNCKRNEIKYVEIDTEIINIPNIEQMAYAILVSEIEKQLTSELIL
jgi:hypothetical protein